MSAPTQSTWADPANRTSGATGLPGPTITAAPATASRHSPEHPITEPASKSPAGFATNPPSLPWSALTIHTLLAEARMGQSHCTRKANPKYWPQAKTAQQSHSPCNSRQPPTCELSNSCRCPMQQRQPSAMLWQQSVIKLLLLALPQSGQQLLLDSWPLLHSGPRPLLNSWPLLQSGQQPLLDSWPLLQSGQQPLLDPSPLLHSGQQPHLGPSQFYSGWIEHIWICQHGHCTCQ